MTALAAIPAVLAVAAAGPVAALEIAFPLSIFVNAGAEIVGEAADDRAVSTTVRIGKHEFRCDPYAIDPFPGFDTVTCRASGALAGFDLDEYVGFLRANECGVTQDAALRHVQGQGYDLQDLAAATNALIYQRLGDIDTDRAEPVFVLNEAECGS